MRRVGMVGGGLMGCGIAAQIAKAGFDVVVWDESPHSSSLIRARCKAILLEAHEMGQVEGGVEDALERIGVADSLDDFAGADLVMEAVSESLGIKREVYASLERVVSDQAVIASSTSGFLPNDLCVGMRNLSRFLVCHFWNPPHVIPLVEVVGATETGSDAVARVMDFLTSIRCEPVFLKKAIPGFVGNRFQFAVLREALHMLQEGVADEQTLDKIFMSTLGRRYRVLGPFKAADVGGLSTFLKIAQHLFPELCKDDAVWNELEKRSSAGHVGLASGKGFYSWTDADRKQLERDRRKMAA